MVRHVPSCARNETMSEGLLNIETLFVSSPCINSQSAKSKLEIAGLRLRLRAYAVRVRRTKARVGKNLLSRYLR
jgi:hypothetical protein